MHELSIAISLVEVAAEEFARHRGRRVRAVHLGLGPLSGVVKDALLAAYVVACEGTPLEGSRLVIRDVPLEIFCAECRGCRPARSIQDVRCTDCGASSARVVRGRELEVFAMEIDDGVVREPDDRTAAPAG